VVPPLTVLSGSGIVDIWTAIGNRLRIALAVTVGVLTALTAWETVRLHPHQKLYFNLLVAGGLDRAWSRYRIDPIENSYKEAVEWIEQHAAAAGGTPPRISGLHAVYRTPALSASHIFVDLP
jgi:hypothetical protein